MIFATLDRKLFRDLWHLRGQVIAIALVIGSGVTTYLVSITTLDSLQATQQSYYQRYRFAEVFAPLKRAPQTVAAQLREISGVGQMETRVVAGATLNVAGFTDPVNGRLVSIPDDARPLLNDLYLDKGRLPAPGSDDEVVISGAFAEAHRLGPGDSLQAVINGRRQRLLISGVGGSPEFVYQIRPGDLFPDFKRYAILWMRRDALAAAYDMEGAFNNVVLSLDGGANPQDVIARVDAILDRYGGQGAYARSDQLSNRYLTQEFQGLEVMAAIFPVIFFGVAAFLLNVVVSRLLSSQREEIGTLKAFGYSNLRIGVHFAAFVLAIVALGNLIGCVAGIWMGAALSELYRNFFRFPYLDFVLPPWSVPLSLLISSVAALLGTFHSVRAAAILPPAQAMRPEPPASYRATLLERAGFGRLMDQPSRMIVRHIGRHPVKAMLTVLGIALSVAVLVVGNFQGDAIDYMVGVQFSRMAREDITVSFNDATSRAAVFDLASYPGVERVEPFRAVPARVHFRHRSHRTAVQGYEENARLHVLLDRGMRQIHLPAEGVVLTDFLAELLGAKLGDVVELEMLEGARPTVSVPVAGLVHEYMGVSAYMSLEALDRLMNEGHGISGVFLETDPLYNDRLFSEFERMPRVAGVSIQKQAIQSFYDTMAETVLIFTFVNTILAATIAVGVVYNSARIAYSERSRELASLRVLGFSRGEITYILLGELAVLTLIAIPIGFVLGRGLAWLFVVNMRSEIYRVPLILEHSTYAFAAAVVLAASLASGAAMAVKLRHLDLVAVLKTRE